jgi:hypothetical protein
MAWVKERVTDDGDKRFVACYRDPERRQRSAGTYSSRRAAERAGNREEAKVHDGAWHDHSRGQVTFAEYVETVWLPSRHVETSTLAAYRPYLDKHFIPTFGRRPRGKIAARRSGYLEGVLGAARIGSDGDTPASTLVGLVGRQITDVLGADVASAPQQPRLGKARTGLRAGGPERRQVSNGILRYQIAPDVSVHGRCGHGFSHPAERHEVHTAAGC